MGRFRCHRCRAAMVSTAAAYPLCVDCYASLDASTKDGAIALAYLEAGRSESCDSQESAIMQLLRPFVSWKRSPKPEGT